MTNVRQAATALLSPSEYMDTGEPLFGTEEVIRFAQWWADEKLEEAALSVDLRADSWRSSTIGGTLNYAMKADGYIAELQDTASAVRSLKSLA